MRRLIALVLVALLALALVGCGGGGGDEAAAPPAEDAAAAAPPVAAGTDVTEPLADRSEVETDVFVPFPTGDFVPDEITGRLESGQPMIILFVDSQQKTADDQRTEAKKVADDNRGLVDLVVYDIGNFVSMKSSTGEVSVDEKLATDAKAKQAVGLADALGVSFTPFTVIVDDQGYVVFKARGPIDSELLEQQVARVSR